MTSIDREILGRESHEKGKKFEEDVADVFRLLGWRPTVDYKLDDMQFDIRMEMTQGGFPSYGMVECKDKSKPITQEDVRNFATKVEYARVEENLDYRAVFVSRQGYANNAHVVARKMRVDLRTYDELLLSLVELESNLDAAIAAFERPTDGRATLQSLYVEQEVVLDTDLRSTEILNPRPLTQTVLEWLDLPGANFLALLGDFGSGKSSFCKRLAWELACKAKEDRGKARAPILVNLREGRSTTVSLENLLTHHFQRLSAQPLNPQSLLRLNQDGYLLLIFDGFDETISYSEPGQYLENLRQILRAAEAKAKVLLTCRTHYFRNRPEALSNLGKVPAVATSPEATRLWEEIRERPGSEVGYVLEFREPQIEQYLQKALPEGTDWRAFRADIKETYNLENLAERPFLLEIIVKTLPQLRSVRGEKKAISIADLYEVYCEKWLEHTAPCHRSS